MTFLHVTTRTWLTLIGHFTHIVSPASKVSVLLWEYQQHNLCMHLRPRSCEPAYPLGGHDFECQSVLTVPFQLLAEVTCNDFSFLWRCELIIFRDGFWYNVFHVQVSPQCLSGRVFYEMLSMSAGDFRDKARDPHFLLTPLALAAQY